MVSILELENISVRGKSIDRLNDINISIDSGEKVALIGKSGAGKSTLITTINGSTKPIKGNVKFKGLSIDKLSTKNKSKISTLWQDLRLIEELNVCQNINCGSLNRKSFLWSLLNLIKSLDIEENKKYLEILRLKESTLYKSINSLSGGQKQRVAIARAIKQESELILADEPLSNLDPKLAILVLELLTKRQINNHLRIPETCIISLHRPDLITYFNRVIGLKHGKIIFDIPTVDINNYYLDKLYNY